MKQFLTLIALCLGLYRSAHAQAFPVDTIQYNGIPSRYINLVILGDGYTLAQQSLFRDNADTVAKRMFLQEPWASYKNYFNIFAVRTVSAQSGIAHAGNLPDCPGGMPTATASNIFGTSFDVGNIHRLVAPSNYSAIGSVLATNFPSYDQVLILANSTWYGGSGGQFATATMSPSSLEVALHEIGHSFASLADEYWYTGGEAPNRTAQSSPTLVKWSAWVGTGGVDVYQHCCGPGSSGWYKPHQACKMNVLDNPFCPVCTEALVEKIHTLTNPLVRYFPSNTAPVTFTAAPTWFALHEVMKPIPNTLSTHWKLDGTTIAQNQDSVLVSSTMITPGTHTLTVTATDTTDAQRVQAHSSLHASTVSWTIQSTATGVEVSSGAREVSLSVFPNPVADWLNLNIVVDKPSDVRLSLLSIDGRVLQTMAGINRVDREATIPVDVRSLPEGLYFLQAEISGELHRVKLIRK